MGEYKYKIRVCIYGEAVDEREFKSLEMARKWWRENWKTTEENGDCFCEWFEDGKYQGIEEKIKLEGE